jgi:hypothetical protein
MPTMIEIVARISKWICFLLAALWLGLILWAQSECPINSPPVGECRLGGSDIWLLPALFSPIGGLAAVASIIIIVAMVHRKRLNRKI